jgi:hypothetical protein
VKGPRKINEFGKITVAGTLFMWAMFRDQLMFVMVKCGGLFEIRTEFISVIYMSFGFKGLNK